MLTTGKVVAWGPLGHKEMTPPPQPPKVVLLSLFWTMRQKNETWRLDSDSSLISQMLGGDLWYMAKP